MSDMTYTPALGRAENTAGYDRAIAFWTRERAWRGALLSQVAPRDGEVILDVGCGTGSFAILMKRAAPNAFVIGMDPDPQVLEIAAAKAGAAGVVIDWRQGFARDAARDGRYYDKTVSSLVFHQVPVAEKIAGIAAMIGAVKAGGEVHIADYARQRTWLMRRLFGIVQRIDGDEDTQPNADGFLESQLAMVDPKASIPTIVVPTPTGAISLFRVVLPQAR